MFGWCLGVARRWLLGCSGWLLGALLGVARVFWVVARWLLGCSGWLLGCC